MSLMCAHIYAFLEFLRILSIFPTVLSPTVIPCSQIMCSTASGQPDTASTRSCKWLIIEGISDQGYGPQWTVYEPGLDYKIIMYYNYTMVQLYFLIR